jgi:lipoprotein-anchoring transpeptidase ErfK/SrfK
MTNRTRKVPLGAVATFAAVAALLLSGCSASAQAQWSPSPGASAPGSGPTSAAAGKITISPAVATGVSPGAPVTVTASDGAVVTAVTLSHGSTKIPGTLSTDGLTWTATGSLAFNTKYTLSVSSTGAATPTTTTTFTTLNPSKTISATLAANRLYALKDGATYGVAQPITVNFGRSIPTSMRAAVTAKLTVDVSPAPVDGRWHWVSSSQVDYRGQDFWPAHSTIKISSSLIGLKIAAGTYLKNNVHSTIKIGDSHVLIANNKTHRMDLYINKLTNLTVPAGVKPDKTIKVSMGMGGSTIGSQGQHVNYWTRNGPHVVITKTPYWDMSSASYGVTDPTSPYYYAKERVYDTVRISYSGEFVHLRTWTVGDIGRRNSSHGCINVGADYAPYLYHLLITGDVVTVTGSPVSVSFDNTVADWAISWDKW